MPKCGLTLIVLAMPTSGIARSWREGVIVRD